MSRELQDKGVCTLCLLYRPWHVFVSHDSHRPAL